MKKPYHFYYIIIMIVVALISLGTIVIINLTQQDTILKLREQLFKASTVIENYELRFFSAKESYKIKDYTDNKKGYSFDYPTNYIISDYTTNKSVQLVSPPLYLPNPYNLIGHSNEPFSHKVLIMVEENIDKDILQLIFDEKELGNCEKSTNFKINGRNAVLLETCFPRDDVVSSYKVNGWKVPIDWFDPKLPKQSDFINQNVVGIYDSNTNNMYTIISGAIPSTNFEAGLMLSTVYSTFEIISDEK